MTSFWWWPLLLIKLSFRPAQKWRAFFFESVYEQKAGQEAGKAAAAPTAQPVCRFGQEALCGGIQGLESSRPDGPGGARSSARGR